jgi:hypothetical protein
MAVSRILLSLRGNESLANITTIGVSTEKLFSEVKTLDARLALYLREFSRHAAETSSVEALIYFSVMV